MNNRANLGHIEIFEFPVDRIHHELFGERLSKHRRMARQLRAQVADAIDGDAVRQNGTGVNLRIRSLSVRGSPAADRIEVLKRQSGRIDHAMALPATACRDAVLNVLAPSSELHLWAG